MPYIKYNIQTLLKVFVIAGLVAIMPLHAAKADGLSFEEQFNTPFNGVQMAQTSDADDVIDDEEDVNDPLEPLNRGIFQLNEGIYTVILRPVARTYNKYVPEVIRDAVANVLKNISTPVTMANNILQGDVEEALGNFAKLVINTTLGMGGINDVASDIGDPVRREDFGQTLAVWGVGEGFYLVLPVLGPSNPRDAFGKYFVDRYFDPLAMYMDNTDVDEYAYITIGATILSEFAAVTDELDEIKENSVDYYAAIRSIYRQRRAAEISNGEDLDLPAIPTISLDLEDIPDDEEAQTRY